LHCACWRRYCLWRTKKDRWYSLRRRRRIRWRWFKYS